MPDIRTLAVIGTLATILGCGSSDTGNNGAAANGGAGVGGSSGTNHTGGSANATGGLKSTGTGGAGTAGGSPSTSTCTVPSCLSTLLNACPTTGSCVYQADLTTLSVNYCFANGVKASEAIDATAGTATMAIRNGSGACYSVDIAGLNDTTGTITFKNSSGTAVATVAPDAAGNTVVTCTGQQPVTLDASCSSSSDITSTTSTSTCTSGTCTL